MFRTLKLKPINNFNVSLTKSFIKNGYVRFLQNKKFELVPKVTYLNDLKSLSEINVNKGLNDFIKTTYKFTGIGIVGTLTLSQILAMVQTPDLNMMLPIFGAGIITSFGAIYGLSKSTYIVHNDRIAPNKENYHKYVDIWYSINSPGRLISYGILISGMAMTICPMVMIANEISGSILPLSVLMTGCIFGGSILYANLRPKGSLLRWEAPLMSSLLGFLGIGLIGFGSHLLFGPNIFSAGLHSINTYGGILLFTVFNAYNTQKSIKMYEEQDPDHLGCSIIFYLDFMNILIRVMEGFIGAKEDGINISSSNISNIFDFYDNDDD